MKFLSTDEYVSNIADLIKKQNKKVSKTLKCKKEQEQTEADKYIAVMKRFEELNKYFRENIYSALLTIANNDRYEFKYFDSGEENKIGDAKYFKIIITNKTTQRNNFLVLTYNFNDIIIKLKPIGIDNETNPAIEIYSIQKFTKGRLRKIFFEYLESIITNDTLPKYKNQQLTSQQEIVKTLQFEIVRMQKITSRNRQILMDTKLHHSKSKLNDNKSDNAEK